MPIRLKEINPSKVAIYIRWSTEDQSEGTTLEVQLENCRKYVEAQGWQVSEDLVYVDDGYSGGSLDRPAITRLRAAVREGKVDCVVVFKLDRLSRNVVDMVNLVIEEWEGRCFVKSAREPIDTTSHAGRMFFYTLSSFSEWERATIRDRTMSGKIRRAQEGRNPGMVPPYGYARGEDGRFVLVPHEAEVVRKVFQSCLVGHSCRRIAAALNALGLLFRQGEWRDYQVSRMLRNPIYTGTLVWGTESVDAKRLSGKARAKNDLPHAVKEGACPAIVTQDEFDRAAAILARRPRPGQGSGRAESSAYLLTGLLKCSVCGWTLRSAPTVPATRQRYDYYRCVGSSRQPPVCKARSIRMDLLDSLVIGALKARYGCEVSRHAYVEEMLKHVRDELAECEASLAHLDRQAAAFEQKERYIRSLLMEQAITPAEYRKMTDDLAEDCRQREEQRQRLQQQTAVLRASLGQAADLEAAMQGLDNWDHLGRVEQKDVLRKFLDRIEVYLAKGDNHLQVAMYWRDRAEQPPQEATFDVPSFAVNWGTKTNAMRR